MKKIAKMTILLAAAALVAASCMRESVLSGHEGEGQPVAISLNAGLTRAGETDPGDALDRAVESLRVLIYDSNTGRLVWNFTPAQLTQSLVDGDNGGSHEMTIEITTGTYDFVFIGNEHSGDLVYSWITDHSTLHHPNISDLLADQTNYDTMAELRQLTIGAISFPFYRGQEYMKLIPMLTHIPKVEVLGDNRINSISTGPLEGTWNVAMERIGIRLDIDIILTAEQDTHYQGLSTCFLLWDAAHTAYMMSRSDNLEHTAAPGKIVIGPWGPNRWMDLFIGNYPAADIFIRRAELDGDNQPTGRWIYSAILLLPERILNATNDTEANAMVLELTSSAPSYTKGTGKSTPIWYEDGNGDPTYSLPRNTFLKMVGEVKEDGIVFSDITVIDWGRVTDINITDRGIVLPKNGVYAPPGVLGVNARTGELTLRGSVHYRGTGVATNGSNATIDFGPISSDTVYVSYFKWGSLIATSSEPGDTTFGAEDIVWAPREYDVQSLMSRIDAAGTGEAKWSEIPYGDLDGPTGETMQTWPATDTRAGLGDPCKLADGGGTKWRVPLGEPWWGAIDIDPFGQVHNLSYADLEALNGGRWATISGSNGFQVEGLRSGDWSIFLPKNDIRLPNGEVFSGDGTMFGYWSSTPSNGSNGINGGDVLFFTTSSIYTFGYHTDFNEAIPIRCMKEPEPDPNHIYAPPGVIGIKHSDLKALQSGRLQLGDNYSLTLRGSSTYAGYPAVASLADEFGGLEEEPVYVVYYKWGSMIAMVGGGRSEGDYDEDRVVWVNPEFDPLQITDSYGNITHAQRNELANSGESAVVISLADGHGDPCATAVHHDGQAGGWRTPIYSDGKWNGLTSPLNLTFIDTIPTNATSGDLSTGVQYNAWLGQGYFFPGAGYYYSLGDNGSFNSIGQYGCYWTSAAGSTTLGFGLEFNTANNWYGNVALLPLTHSNPVRCVPEPTPTIAAVVTEKTDLSEIGGANHSNNLTYAQGYIVAHPEGSPTYLDAVGITVTVTPAGTAYKPVVKIYKEDGITFERNMTDLEIAAAFTGIGTANVTFEPPRTEATKVYNITFEIAYNNTIKSSALNIIYLWGGENHILYFDEGILKVGRWGPLRSGDESVTIKVGAGTEPIKSVPKVSDLAYFKFGSVIGIIGKEAEQGNSYYPGDPFIMFNPTALSPYDVDDIPHYDIWWNPLSVSSSVYHHGVNLRAGKGDPCKLAGFDLSTLDALPTEQAKQNALANYDSGWRLPTAAENDYLVGGPKMPWNLQIGYNHDESGNSGSTDEYANFFVTDIEDGNLFGSGVCWVPVVRGPEHNTYGFPLMPGGEIRADNSYGNMGILAGIGTTLSYLSSTPATNNPPSTDKKYHYMFYWIGSLHPSYLSNPADLPYSTLRAHNVRCVKSAE